MIHEVTDADFTAEVLQGATPVLVDFWAPWCGPCRTVAPILEEIEAEYGDQLKIVKLNIDENPRVTAANGIVSVPTMNVYVDGQVATSINGAHPKPKLLRELSDYIS